MTYATIVADPPWPQRGGGSLKGREGFLDAGGRSLELPYKTMTVSEICEMAPFVSAATLPAAHCYLWTTSGFLKWGFEVLSAWGFDYSTTLVWAKAPIGFGLGGAYGIATEFVLFGRRGTLPAKTKIGRNWWTWKRPYDERGKPRHSSKPEDFYKLVEQVSPGPYLEMFARRTRPGWDAWGDEVAA